jgi:broad specificity phosphatase PhoE
VSGVTSEQTVVYLVRHGVTDWNLQRRFQGQLDVPLSEEGLEQAEAVAGWLAAQPTAYAGLYSSDLKRAMQTAEAIGERLGLETQPVPELREIHCGEWQGLSVDAVQELYPGALDEWRAKVDCFTLPGGESIPEVQRRTFEFFRRVAAKHAAQAIILVSHGAALSALQTSIYGWDLPETWESGKTRLGNTGVTVLSVDPATGLGTVIVQNSVGHLERPTGMASVLDRAV